MDYFIKYNSSSEFLDKSFIICDENKVISYSLFFNNGKESCYFGSYTYRKFNKLYQNITHKSVFESVKYLKKRM
jgi:hypothetical protein